MDFFHILWTKYIANNIFFFEIGIWIFHKKKRKETKNKDINCKERKKERKKNSDVSPKNKLIK